MESFKGHWVVPNGCPHEYLFSLLTFFHFTFFNHSPFLLLLLVSPDADPVLFVIDLQMKYTVELVPLRMYIAWFVIV